MLYYAPVAQRIEQCPSKAKVAGSIPAGCAKISSRASGGTVDTLDLKSNSCNGSEGSIPSSPTIKKDSHLCGSFFMRWKKWRIETKGR